MRNRLRSVLDHCSDVHVVGRHTIGVSNTCVNITADISASEKSDA
jgi:hypothetical protein